MPLIDERVAPGADPWAPGDVIEFPAPGGTSFSGVLKQLDDTHALLDFNHPLAGRPVVFEVEILGIL